MKKILIVALLLVTAPFGVTNVSAMDDIQTLKNTIQAKGNNFSALYNAHDIKGLVELYTVDAIFVAPGNAPAYGREAIAQTLTGVSAALSDLALFADNIRPINDDHAIELGRSIFNAKDENGNVVKGNGTYIIVWKKSPDGGWYILTDIFTAGPAQ